MSDRTLRGFCRVCNRLIALHVPKGGDGSLWITAPHGPRVARCSGSGQEPQ